MNLSDNFPPDTQAEVPPSMKLLQIAHEARAQAEMALLRALNPLFFALRGAMKFRRAGYSERPGPIRALPDDWREQLKSDRARELESRYGLGVLRPNLTHACFLGVLSFTDLMDRMIEIEPRLAGPADSVEALDIGCKNFESAPALFHVLSRNGGGERHRRVALTGVEIDAHRIYRSWHSRADVADYYLSLIRSADSDSGPHNYLGMNAMDHEGAYDLITWFYPFVDAYPLLHWGLPARLLRPRAMFEHMLAMLKPGGAAVIVNQELHERDLQIELANSAGTDFVLHEIELAFRAKQPIGFACVIFAPGGPK